MGPTSQQRSINVIQLDRATFSRGELLWQHFWSGLRAFMLGSVGMVLTVFAIALANPLRSHGNTYRPVPASSIKPGSVSGDPAARMAP